MVIGSELLLVGYPAEVDLFPQPSVTRGILVRFREWERLGMTYFQTDASVAGGQSGGALVNARGQVIGISGLTFSEAGFGLAASSADIVPIVEKLTKGELAADDRRLPVGRGSFEFDIELRNHWDTRIFVLKATEGTILEVEIEGSGDGWFQLSDSSGSALEVDAGNMGIAHSAVELLTSGPHFLHVGMASRDSSRFDLVGSVRLQPLNDPDDGRTITVGNTVAGSLDFFYDLDWYSIRLKEGETVRIFTDSLNVDTVIYVDFPNSRDNQIVVDDDSGGGLYGTNSDLTYRAPRTGEYFIAVTGSVGDSSGGYYLTVQPAPEGTETVVVPPSPKDEGVDRRSHDLIQWDQYPTYDGHSVTFSGTLLNDAVLSETIHEAREGGGYANFTLSPADEHRHSGTIFVPLEEGRRWILDYPGDTVATVYRLNDRAFTVKFPFPQALDSPSDYVVTVWGFADESRTPIFGYAVDVLGYARIRSTASESPKAES